MTEEIYNLDAYAAKCDAVITKIQDEGIFLDSTVFFPGGGGQPCDKGIMKTESKDLEVNQVKRIEGEIFHFVNTDNLNVGDKIQCVLNWKRRHNLMKTHTALHIMCGVVWRDFQALATGGNMNELNGRIDFEFESLTSEMTKDIEEKINLEVNKNLPISVGFISREKAEKIPGLIRTKINLLPASIKTLRTIDIEGLDIQADGGTHVKSTSEVGKVKVVGHQSKGKSNKRIRIEIE
ncbi:MAG: alanyl-tRNA editing protein [Chloroflexota bacterium]